MLRIRGAVARQGLAAVWIGVLGSGCSSSWPRAYAASSASFVADPSSTIDILPVDLEVWTDRRVDVDADQVRQQAESRIVATTSELLYQRGYSVGTIFDWRGQYVTSNGQQAQAYEPAQLLSTINSLASYGSAMVVTPTEMPVPYLPVRLGDRTNADATLYIGGWGFVGRPQSSTGSTVLKGIAVGIIVLSAVAILAVLSKKNSAVKNVADGAAKGLGRAGSIATSAGRLALRAGTAVVRAGIEISLDVIAHPPTDALGRSETHINLVSGRPEWSPNSTGKRNGASALYLEMTLVDNRTGLVRWHSHQRFPAGPNSDRDVARAVRTMIQAMPARYSPSPGL
jgi:hypothetical protein